MEMQVSGENPLAYLIKTEGHDDLGVEQDRHIAVLSSSRSAQLHDVAYSHLPRSSHHLHGKSSLAFDHIPVIHDALGGALVCRHSERCYELCPPNWSQVPPPLFSRHHQRSQRCPSPLPTANSQSLLLSTTIPLAMIPSSPNASPPFCNNALTLVAEQTQRRFQVSVTVTLIQKSQQATFQRMGTRRKGSSLLITLFSFEYTRITLLFRFISRMSKVPTAHSSTARGLVVKAWSQNHLNPSPTALS